MNHFRKIINLYFLFLGLSLTNGQCPANEIFSECEDACNTCDGNQICPEWCLPGCQCLPGYSRDNNMNCIPRQFCTRLPGKIPYKPDPEVSRLLAWEDNKKGCPNEMQCKRNCGQESSNFDGICTGPNKKYCQCYICKALTPTTDTIPTSGGTEGCPNVIKCFRSCTKRGFPSGQCIGPQRLNCQCQNRSREASDSLLSPIAIRGGCPVRSLCLAFCQGRGFNSGICLGPKSELCNCFSSATPPNQLPVPRGGLNPLLSPNTVRGGCPVRSLCLTFCQGRGLSNGICLGPRNEYCNCFSSSLPPNPLPPPIPSYGRPLPPAPVLPPAPALPPAYALPPAHALPPTHALPPVNALPPAHALQPAQALSPVGCPNIAQCVFNCRSLGKVAGFCTGVGRRKCECV